MQLMLFKDAVSMLPSVSAAKSFGIHRKIRLECDGKKRLETPLLCFRFLLYRQRLVPFRFHFCIAMYVSQFLID